MTDDTTAGDTPARAPNLFELVCPRCRRPIEDRADTIHCPGCRRSYPKVGDIPVLVPEPEALIDHWCNLTQKFDEDTRRGLNELLAYFTTHDLPQKTRTRLKTLHQHLDRHRARLLELLTAAGVRIGGLGSLSSGDATLHHGSIVDYYAQIHRDWGWEPEGGREALEASESVGSLLSERELGRFLVLGAGACRLTRDLHHRFHATATLALDVDPLPFVVAERLLRGGTVQLYEFPPWPLDSTKLFADRALSSGMPSDPTLRLLFADARDPPLQPQSVDSVLTPWFIDLVDMPALFEKIWRVLVPGGLWINFGPLLYGEGRTGLPGRYCIDEVFDMVEAAGFSVESHTFRRMSYMHSPLSCQGRVETVLTFSARRLADKPAKPGAQLPDWLLDATLPVPKLPGLERYEPTHAMLRTIVNLIDGKRSASDIADLLVRRHSLPRDDALTAVTACLRAIELEARAPTTARPR